MSALGCKHIKRGRNYYTASNPDGDNKAAINVHIETLYTVNHTRSDFPKKADIITLVEYIKGFYFTKAIYWICEVCGWDYYYSGDYFGQGETEDPCLLALEEIEPRTKDDEPPLRKLDDIVLNEFVQYPHRMFLDEGISYEAQKIFEIGYSLWDECITIPIRDELGNLVGVKGRTVFDHEKLKISKYWFPYAVPKTQILFGLDKTYEHIKRKGVVIVFEGEKSVIKAYGWGFKYCVSVGGHELSSTQVLKLEKLGVKIVLAFDRDVSADEIKYEANKFLFKENLYTIYPQKNKQLLKKKDAPVDQGKEVFIKLLKEDCYKIFN